MLLMAAE